jgi:hypothetical protein
MGKFEEAELMISEESNFFESAVIHFLDVTTTEFGRRITATENVLARFERDGNASSNFARWPVGWLSLISHRRLVDGA